MTDKKARPSTSKNLLLDREQYFPPDREGDLRLDFLDQEEALLLDREENIFLGQHRSLTLNRDLYRE